jgi:hypothetical protein
MPCLNVSLGGADGWGCCGFPPTVGIALVGNPAGAPFISGATESEVSGLFCCATSVAILIFSNAYKTAGIRSDQDLDQVVDECLGGTHGRGAFWGIDHDRVAVKTSARVCGRGDETASAALP